MKLNLQERRALNVAVGIAALVAVLILGQFLSAIIAAAIAAVIFVPLNNWLTKKTKKAGLSVTLTTLISILVLIIPVILVVWVSVAQVQTLVSDVDTAIESGSEFLQEDKVLVSLNERLDSWTNGRVELSIEDIQTASLNAAKAIGEGTLNFLKSTIGSIPQLITQIIIFFYVFVALLGNYKKLLNFLRKLNPLGDEVSNLYMQKARDMTNAMVKGQFVVALAQGFVGALSVQIAGIHYFAFFFLILTVLSIIPLGGGLLTIPIGFIMILAGNVPGGLIVLITHFLVVTNIDNVIRPKLVPKEAELHPALTMVAVFSGLALFGFLGIVAGPVLFIIALTTMQVYVKVKDDMPSAK